MNRTLVLLAFPLLVFAGCSRTHVEGQQWEVGGLYSVENGNGSFGVAKVLALDSDRVHVRIYKQKFSSRPGSIDPNALTLGAMGDKEGFGIGHLPLSRKTFAAWNPVLISRQSVTEKELEATNSGRRAMVGNSECSESN